MCQLSVTSILTFPQNVLRFIDFFNLTIVDDSDFKDQNKIIFNNLSITIPKYKRPLQTLDR